MGAANCCKKPEEVLEEGKFTAVGGSYENPHVIPLDKDEKDEGKGGFPHDSESQALKSQNVEGLGLGLGVGAGVGVGAEAVADNTANEHEHEQEQEQEDDNNAPGQNDAKLYEHYFDATKVGSAYEVPPGRNNLTGYEMQNQMQNANAVSGYELPKATGNYQPLQGSPNVEGTGYELPGAKEGGNEMTGAMVSSSQGFDVNANATKQPVTTQSQNYELQQAGAANANMQYEMPKADATATVNDSANLAAAFDFHPGAADMQTGAGFPNIQVTETTQPTQVVTTVRTPIVTSNIAPVTEETNIQANNPLSFSANLNASAQNNEFISSIQNNQADFTFAASANANVTENVPTTDYAALGIQDAGLASYGLNEAMNQQDTNIQFPDTTGVANAQYAIPPMENAQVVSAASNNFGAFDFGNYVDSGVDLGIGAQAQSFGPGAIEQTTTDFTSFGMQGVPQTNDFNAYQFDAGSAGATMNFGSYSLGPIQTEEIVTGMPIESTVVKAPVTTTSYTTSYQIPATTTTTKTVYQSAFAAPTTTTTLSLGLPTVGYGNTVTAGQTFI